MDQTFISFAVDYEHIYSLEAPVQSSSKFRTLQWERLGRNTSGKARGNTMPAGTVPSMTVVQMHFYSNLHSIKFFILVYSL